MSGGAMLAAVDIGNSSTKIGLLELPVAAGVDGSMLPRQLLDFPTGQPLPAAVAERLLSISAPLRWEIASVNRGGTATVEAWVHEHRPQDTLRVLTRHDLPIALLVDQPERVGLDRMLVAVVANRLRSPSRPAVVICAGTAVTMNVVNRQGEFLGGAILPGFQMQSRSLRGGTDQLPLTEVIHEQLPPPAIGRNTEEAIRSGLYWGMVGAVQQLVAETERTLGEAPELFVTGGDLDRLAALSLEQARFLPSMVLQGIASLHLPAGH
nr:type III pantothenate kinase [Pirellula staleyi]